MAEPGRGRRRLIGGTLLAVVLIAGFVLLREPSPPSQPLGAMPSPLPTADAQRGGASLAVQREDPGLAQVGARWYMNWDHRPHDDVDAEFVPLVCGYPGDRQVTQEALDEVQQTLRDNPEWYPDGTIFLVGNEIGYVNQNDERTPQEYADDFHRCHEALTAVNASFRVSVGPVILSPDEGITDDIVGAEDGLDYLGQVIEAYRAQQGEEIPADYFAATNHVMSAADLHTFTERIVQMRQLLHDVDLRERGVILTEIGVPTRGSSPAQIEKFLAEAVHFVSMATDETTGHPSDGRLVQRWAWFTAQPLSLPDKVREMGLGAFFLRFAQTSLFDHDGEVTHLGQVFRALMSPPAEG